MKNEKPKDEAKYLYDRFTAVCHSTTFHDLDKTEFIKLLAWEAVDIMMGQLGPNEMVYWMKVKKKIQKL